MNKKLENLTDTELRERRSTLQKKIDKESIIYAESQNKLIKMRDKMSKIDNEIDTRTLSLDDPAAILENFPETEAKRKLFSEYMRSLSLYDGGGYWVDNNQRVVKFMLYRNDDEHTKKVHAGIMIVLPYVKERENGLKMFDIFEHTLSYNYSYYLAYDVSTDTWFITTNRKTRDEESKDLMTVLKYIQKYLYYEIDNPYKEDENE